MEHILINSHYVVDLPAHPAQGGLVFTKNILPVNITPYLPLIEARDLFVRAS